MEKMKRASAQLDKSNRGDGLIQRKRIGSKRKDLRALSHRNTGKSKVVKKPCE